jgi:hypothetical protein
LKVGLLQYQYQKRGFRIILVGAGVHNVHISELGTDEMIELSEKYSWSHNTPRSAHDLSANDRNGNG